MRHGPQYIFAGATVHRLFSEVVWELIQTKYWLRPQARRRHTRPFSKTSKGLAQRKTRHFVRLQEHTVRG